VKKRVRQAGEARRLRARGMTVERIAEGLGVGLRTVYRWTSSG
jgi:transposase